MDARTSNTVPARSAVVPQSGAGAAGWAAVVPTVLALLALGVADAHYGGFTIDRWGPLAVFVLVVLAIVVPGRSIPRGARVPLAAIGGFAAWSLASVAWGQIPGAAWQGGARNVLIAGLFALPLVSAVGLSQARAAADLLVGVLAALVAGTLVAYLVDPGSLFLAGRLEAPIAYRNGTAVLFAMAFWPLVCTAASRRVLPGVRPLALALATCAAGFAFLTQSRGVLIGTAMGGVVVIALGPERVRRALLGLVAVAPVALFSHRLLQPYDTFNVASLTVPHALTDARGALLLATAMALAAGVLIAVADHVVAADGSLRRSGRIAAIAVLVVVCLAGIGAAVRAVGNPVTFVRDKTDEFTALQNTDSGATRLGSVGGQRSDLWRVALKEFSGHPLAGVGEGGYPVGYYIHRRTDRNVIAAHSLPFGTLAELGIVGVLLLLAFVGGCVITIAQRVRSATLGDRRRVAALASVAAVFLGQAIVDWFWTIPGLTGLTVVALALALVLVGGETRAPAPAGRARRLLPAVVCAILALVVAAQVLADREVHRARAATSQDQRLARARTAADLDPFASAPRYIQAGALEAQGRPASARRVLLGVLDREPLSFVAPALLGDLETRRGNVAIARQWYRRALARNPLDTGLRKLAAR